MSANHSPQQLADLCLGLLIHAAHEARVLVGLEDPSGSWLDYNDAARYVTTAKDWLDEIDAQRNLHGYLGQAQVHCQSLRELVSGLDPLPLDMLADANPDEDPSSLVITLDAAAEEVSRALRRLGSS